MTTTAEITYCNFLERADERNFPLKIQDKIIWVSRDVLALHSPVFKNIFFGDFRENNQGELELPGKTYLDFVELLRCILPCPTVKPIDDANVDFLLSLSDEYELSDLRNRCEAFVRLQAKEVPECDSYILDLLAIASQHNIIDVAEKLVPKAARLPLNDLRKYFALIKPDLLLAVYDAKIGKWARCFFNDQIGPGCKECISCAKQTVLTKCNKCSSSFCRNCKHYCGPKKSNTHGLAKCKKCDAWFDGGFTRSDSCNCFYDVQKSLMQVQFAYVTLKK